MRRKVLIMGAAGRDFHNFNVCYRDNSDYEVIAFTATQIPDIEDRLYPPELSGKLYPEGIPIQPEKALENLIEEKKVDDVIFAYSDVSHEYVMHQASRVIACGANFTLLGANATMIKSGKPVISICAVRTGCGKSQTTRKIAHLLKAMGKKVAAVRHPMPYGNLIQQIMQRYASVEDMDRNNCTIEEREEYEPLITEGFVLYAGIDYEKILREAEKEADVILWDGGNNDLPFFKPDLEIVVTDPHRAGDELIYHPGETNLLRADVIIINKVDTAETDSIDRLKKNIVATNTRATIITAASPISIEDEKAVKGKRVLVVEDGPTLTHGNMTYGAGIVAARKYGALEIIDPRPYVSGSIAEIYEKYPFIGPLLPAMGYGDEQMKELENVINRTPCDLVIIGTPINLGKLLNINRPTVRVTYELEEKEGPNLAGVLESFFKK